MIIDEILNVSENPERYNAREFYCVMNGYREWGWDVARAMDAGSNEDVQNELCAYVISEGYDPQICRFILGFNWIMDMDGAYIVLVESGKRLDIADANQFAKDEWVWDDGKIGLCYDGVSGCCFSPDEDFVMATTHLFRLYDRSGHCVFEDVDHITKFWL